MFATGNGCGGQRIVTRQLDPRVWVLLLEDRLVHPQYRGPRVSGAESQSAVVIHVEIQIEHGHLLSSQGHCFTSQYLGQRHQKHMETVESETRKGHT